MLTVKQLLVTQLAQAFEGRPDMPLMASLAGVSEAEAAWRPGWDVTGSEASRSQVSPEPTPSIDEIVRHIAWAKSRFCQQAFGTPMIIDDRAVTPDGDSEGVPFEMPCGCLWGLTTHPGIDGAVTLLREAHAVMTRCLTDLEETKLDQPLPVRHGSSAWNFFWTMLMHDVYHAGQIRTRRTMYANRQ